MGEGFLKFKRKVHIDAIIKSAVIGLFVGAPIFTVLFILSKRQVIGMHGWLCAVLGIVAALIAGGLAYIFLRPNNKKLAKKLDKELALHEKVQTMVEFKDAEDIMAALQREDTDERLRLQSVSGAKFTRLWMYITAGVLSVAMLVTAFAVPKKKEPEPVDPPFQMNNWQQIALEDLIEYTQSSGMIENAKSYTVAQLEGLLKTLLDTEYTSEMKQEVISVIVGVDGKVDEVNSYTAIHGALSGSLNDEVVELSGAIAELDVASTTTAFTELRNAFTYAEYKNATETFVGQTRTSLGKSGYNQEDELYAAVEKFLVSLETIAKDFDGYDETALNAALDGAEGVGGIFGTAADDIHDAIVQQKTNRTVGKYVISELMEIFEISKDELPDLGADEVFVESETGGGQTGDENDKNDGGYGKGEQLFGSNDQIYDPEKGHVAYGEVLNEYFAKVSEQLVNGTLSEEMQEFINGYYAQLYNGSKDGQ